MGFALAALDVHSDIKVPFRGIPDGFAGSTVSMCHKTRHVIIPDAAGNITFAVLPTLPASLWVFAGITTWTSTPGGPEGFSGTNHVVNVTQLGNLDWAGVPCNFWCNATDAAIRTMQNNLSGATNTPAFINATNGMAAARFAGLGFEVKPTGVLANTTGIVATGRGSFRLKPNLSCISSGDHTNQLPAQFLDGLPNTFQSVLALEDSKECTVGDGAYVMCSTGRSKDRWGFVDFQESMQSTWTSLLGGTVVPFMDSTWLTNTPLLVSNSGITPVTARPNFDNFFIADYSAPDTTVYGFVGSVVASDSLGFAIYCAAGLPTNFSIEVDVLANVEYLPQSESPYVELATPALPLNQALLDEVEAASQRLPVCVGYRENSSGSFTRTVLSLLSGGLQFVSRLRIPIVSTGAQLAYELQRFLNISG